MRSQIEKFDAKYGKQVADENALHELSRNRREERLARYSHIDKVDELKEHGKIEEAAAVFSSNGLQLLTQTMLNSVEERLPSIVEQTFRPFIESKLAEITQSLNLKPVIEEIVTEKMLELIAGLTRGINQKVETAYTTEANTASNDAESVSERSETSSNTNASKANQSAHQARINALKTINDERSHRTSLDAQLVYNTLKNLGYSIKLKELRKLLPDFPWSANPYTKMEHLMRHVNIKKDANGYFAE